MRIKDYIALGALVGVALVAVITYFIHPEREWFFMLIGWWVMFFGLVGLGCGLGRAYAERRGID